MHNANEKVNGGANGKQVGGDHYATGGVQHWDYVQEALDGAYLMGNVTKYVARHRKKNGLQDLQKAKHYLQKIIELYMAGAVPPARLPGYIGEMPAIVGQLIHHAGLNYWEGRVMVLACLWGSLNELTELRAMIDHLVKVEEEVNSSAIEPGANYVNPDGNHYELNPFAVGELEQFVCWLSVQSPDVVFGSSRETPAQLEVLRRYERLTKVEAPRMENPFAGDARPHYSARCPVDFSQTANFGGQTSKRLDVHLEMIGGVTTMDVKGGTGEDAARLFEFMTDRLSNLNGG